MPSESTFPVLVEAMVRIMPELIFVVCYRALLCPYTSAAIWLLTETVLLTVPAKGAVAVLKKAAVSVFVGGPAGDQSVEVTQSFVPPPLLHTFVTAQSRWVATSAMKNASPLEQNQNRPCRRPSRATTGRQRVSALGQKLMVIKMLPQKCYGTETV